MINLKEEIKNSDVFVYYGYSKEYPFSQEIHEIMNIIDSNLLELLSKEPPDDYKGGKGGNTNYAEEILKETIGTLDNVITDPNGTQNKPDVLINGEALELKTVKKGSFAFNDSIPGNILYMLLARHNKKYIILDGKCLTESMDPTQINMVTDIVKSGREAGKSKKDSIAYFYPRINLFIKNIIKYAPCSGFYEWKNKTIWVPRSVYEGINNLYMEEK